MSFTIFQNEKTPFKAIATKISRSRKIDICPNGLTHGFWFKNVHFSNRSFQAIQNREMSFTIFQNRKNSFLSYKNKKFKQSKNSHFSKGVNTWFSSKNGHFSNFSFQAIQARKMSFTIFQNKKTPLQAIKTKSLKSRKIDIFPKGLTHGFGPKVAIFPTFLFKQYGPEKCLLRYSRTKKRLCRL